MINVRLVAVSLLALAAGFPAAGQSVVSTHSGTVYFFVGTVFVGGERLEQKFGKFPDIGEGRELRTEIGRAEVLLTAGAVLRIGENSAIRMVSTSLADTRVELLAGSAILESNDARTDAGVRLIHKNWQARLVHTGAYRMDAEPSQICVYKGSVEVTTASAKEPVVVKEGETLPLAAVLLTEHSGPAVGDSFKSWAMNRSQAVAADNATAAGIIDDPNQFDTGGLAAGGYSYFPPLGSSSLGITNPYGVSFWSPYQSVLNSIYFPPYMYGGYGYGYGGYGVVRSGWVGGGAVGTYPGAIHGTPRPIYPTPIATPLRIGVHPGGGSVSRTPLPSAPSHPLPHPPPPSVGIHSAGHR